jgi:hypothetical protein
VAPLGEAEHQAVERQLDSTTDAAAERAYRGGADHDALGSHVTVSFDPSVDRGVIHAPGCATTARWALIPNGT